MTPEQSEYYQAFRAVIKAFILYDRCTSDMQAINKLDAGQDYIKQRYYSGEENV